jgi:hypothetical protein
MNMYRFLCFVAVLLPSLGAGQLLHAPNPSLTNLSPRARIGTGGNILIAGRTRHPVARRLHWQRPERRQHPEPARATRPALADGVQLLPPQLRSPATLATWFGVSATDLPIVLPNIGRFAKPNFGFLA